MKTPRLMIAPAALASLLLSGLAPAAAGQQPGADSTAAQPGQPGSAFSGHFSRADTQAFIDEAAYASRGEIDAAHYVLGQSGSSAVKAFASRMVHDHTQALKQLFKAADQAGMKVPAGLDPTQKAALSQLQQVHGPQLNLTYATSQKQDHEKTIDRFEHAAHDPMMAGALRRYAQKTLPILRQHLRLATHLAAGEVRREGTAT